MQDVSIDGCYDVDDDLYRIYLVLVFRTCIHAERSTKSRLGHARDARVAVCDLDDGPG